MKKLLSMVLALTLLMSSLTALAAVVTTTSEPETGIIFADDFEDYAGMETAEAKAAAKANWNYGVGGDILTADGNTFLSNPYVYYQLPYAKITSGKVLYEYDVYIPSDCPVGNGLYSVVYSGDDASSWFPAHYVWSALKTDSGAIVYWGDAENYGAMPRPGGSYTPASNEISTNEWHKVGTTFDYLNNTMDFYLDGKKVAEHTKNATFSAPVERAGFKYFGILRVANGSTARADNVKFEKMQSFVDPESVGSYTVNGSVPETGIIAKDNFDNYENSDWTGGRLSSISNPDNVWHYTLGDILPSGSDGNKYLNMRWTSNTAYYLTDHNLPGAVINTGKLKIEYKVNVRQMNVSDNTLANPENGDRQVLYVANWGPNGKMYLNTVVYSPEKPFMAFSKTLNNYSAANETNTDAPTVKKTFDFETWNTVTMIIDYENGTVCQYFNGEFVTSFAVDPTNTNIEFNEFDLCRSHSKNGQEISGAADVYYPNGESVDIRIDDVRIERLVPVSYDEPLTTKIKKNGADITVADVAGGDVLTVDFETPSASTGNVVIAAYKGEQLQGVVSSINTLISKGSNSIALTADDKFEGADTIKAFIFSNFDNMYPMADAAVYTK